MKKIALVVFWIFISQNVFSQTYDHVKLFAEVMPFNDILHFPKQAKKSFEVHLPDSYKYFPSFNDLQNKNLIQFNEVLKIRGTMKYVKGFPMPYAYDVTNQNQVYTHEVKIYFLNATSADKQFFAQLLREAEQAWNSQKISMDFIYNFKFTLTEDIREAHYRVFVLDSTRGPYNISWGRNWDSIIVTHELGHMMGLADEYETLTSESYCLPHSLMCSSRSGDLMKHHYYFILRRLVNNSAKRSGL